MKEAATLNVCVEWTLEKQQCGRGEAADGRVMGTGPREGGRAAQGSSGGWFRGLECQAKSLGFELYPRHFTDVIDNVCIIPGFTD